MARGWIDKQTGETAAQLKTRLGGLSDFFKISRNGGSTIAYSANGLILRQREETVVEECRGLTEAAAELLKGLESDNTETVIYYKAVGENGEYATVGIIVGTKVVVSSRRANEAAGWTANITTTTMGPEAATGWTTTRPSTATSTGVVSDYSQGAKRINTKAFASSVAYGQICVLYENFTRRIRTFMFLTQAEAETKVAALNSESTGSTIAAKMSWVDGLTSFITTCLVRNYTSKVAKARYVSAEKGWEVQCEEITYAPAAKYWRGESVESANYKYWQYEADGTTQNITATPFARAQITMLNVNGSVVWKIEEA